MKMFELIETHENRSVTQVSIINDRRDTAADRRYVHSITITTSSSVKPSNEVYHIQVFSHILYVRKLVSMFLFN